MTLSKRAVLFFAFFIAICISARSQAFEQTGNASYYHSVFQGHYTSSGEIFDNEKYTGAHATLPFQTIVKITNLKNNKSVIVKINDRCARLPNHVIDLSQAAFKYIDFLASGITSVKLEILSASDSLKLGPCLEDTLSKAGAVDSSSLKSQLMLKNYRFSPFEQLLFGNIIASQKKAYKVKTYIIRKQKLMALLNMYFLRAERLAV